MKTLVAMSGGVDSSAAAFLLTEKGYNVSGALMKLVESVEHSTNTRSCCSLNDSEDARAVADKLNIPFYVFNFVTDFEEYVIKKFVDSYISAQTPNPCIDCNKYLKFERFLQRAIELEFDTIATGHYAVNEKLGDRYLLKKGKDSSKDQTYFLYTMTQEQLKRTLFPLGTLNKEEVRLVAESCGLINASKPDSQDICFAPDNNYTKFIEEYTGNKSLVGDFADVEGNIVGKHNGLIHYTIGQRTKLSGLKEPMYIRSMCSATNRITICTNEELYALTVTADNINFIPFDAVQNTVKVEAKLRYHHKPAKAELIQTDSDKIEVRFFEPQRAVTPGQSIVLYDGDYVIGGGRITNTEDL